MAGGNGDSDTGGEGWEGGSDAWGDFEAAGSVSRSSSRSRLAPAPGAAAPTTGTAAAAPGGAGGQAAEGLAKPGPGQELTAAPAGEPLEVRWAIWSR